MSDEVLYCIDFDKIPGRANCCPMCHEDDNNGECHIEEQSINGLRVRVCCDTARWLEVSSLDYIRAELAKLRQNATP